MFATKEEIRRAARAKLVEKERRKVRREVAEMLRRHGVRDEATGRITLELTPEVAAFLYPPDSELPDASRRN